MTKIIKLQFIPQLLFVFFFILLLPYTSLAASNSLEIHFIDVGLGDCTLIKLPSGANILIDTGSPASAPAVVQYLRSLRIEKIDHLILTHPHDDHIGGISGIADSFPTGKFYDNGTNNMHAIDEGYLAIVRSDTDRYEVLYAGESLVFDNIKFDILNPPSPPAGDPNNDSIVIRLRYNKFALLLAGDIGFKGEKRILSLDVPLKSQVLKIAHHGENDSTSAEFLQRVGPEAAIITVSRINEYSRPHRQVLKRLHDGGAKIYRSDVNGNIILRTDGNSFSVKTEK